MSGFANRGKKLILQGYFNSTAATNLYVALCTSAATPTADTNTLSELTEIAVGNGYVTGGMSLTRNATDFPSLAEDDVNDRASVTIKTLEWTATGGYLPSSGNGARWLVLTDDNVTIGSRQVIAYFDLQADRTVSDGQKLTITTPEIRATE